jgi:hypothetical protein
VAFSGYEIGISVISIMIAAAGIILGIGYAMNDRKLKEFGLSEIYQSLINAAILGSIIVAFGSSGLLTGVINSLSTGVTPQSCQSYFYGNSALCFSYNYLVGGLSVVINGNIYPSLITSTTGLLAAVTGLYIVIGTLASVSINVFVISVSLQGLAVFLGPLRGLTDFLAFAMISIIAQAALLKFVSITAISFMLPVGLVLRTFYFTRRLGGTIIAIAIGLFVVLPMTYVFSAYMIDSFATGGSQQVFAQAIGALNSSSSSTSTTSQLVARAVSLASPVGGAASGITGSLLSALGSASGVMTALINTVGDAIAFLIVQVFVLPTFDIVLTIVSIRELARILGSEVSLGRFDIF